MSDVVAYVMITGLIVLGMYASIRVCLRIMQVIYENQTLILSLPFG